MKLLTKLFVFTFLFLTVLPLSAQDYFLKRYEPYDKNIPSPEEFLGYAIGERHTRHDLIVAYFNKLAEISPKVNIEYYGETHEYRKLVMLSIATEENQQNLAEIRENHLATLNSSTADVSKLPIIIQLGYGVHGNEPSSAEAAMLTAYTLIASQHPEIQKYVTNSVIFIDPVINPDGRDRHTNWANQYRANPLVSDNYDAEHNEAWPRGRTNHFWFDLNRDWFLAVNPESRGKLNWYHKWYPNVVTDFHEMGTNSTYFFEPMKPIGSKDPIMPKENYEDLNSLFATYFQKTMDSIGSFYYTKESFDGTYPGYGSSYPDLQGGLALLFEQASSRGHLQDTDYGTISFAFTIRNQYVNSLATVQAAVENKDMLRKYQHNFFTTAKASLPKNSVKGYQFDLGNDKNRVKAFIDKLLLHKIKVYSDKETFYVPLQQPQKRIVQNVFETYNVYRDSVFYDASAWSLANFYNIKYKETRSVSTSNEVTNLEGITSNEVCPKASYAYLIDWNDYNAPAALHYLQKNEIIVATSFKPFQLNTNAGIKSFDYGTLLVSVPRQKLSVDEVFKHINYIQNTFNVPVYAAESGFSSQGIDLGSNNIRAIEKPKAVLLIGEGVSSYEAGEVWHLLDTRMHMPITKVQMQTFGRLPLDKYNTLVMVSGNYSQLDSLQIERIKQWVSKGNTLITIAGASNWAVSSKIVKEKLVKPDSKDEEKQRGAYVNAPEELGRERLGGAIFKVDLDITHPIGFGYSSTQFPVYKNNTVFLEPSTNRYATVAKYTQNPHIDGFVSNKNLETMKKSASILVSGVGRGRVVMFADNPNFRGSWYGTNKLFMNALFLGNHIQVPR